MVPCFFRGLRLPSPELSSLNVVKLVQIHGRILGKPYKRSTEQQIRDEEEKPRPIGVMKPEEAARKDDAQQNGGADPAA